MIDRISRRPVVPAPWPCVCAIQLHVNRWMPLQSAVGRQSGLIASNPHAAAEILHDMLTQSSAIVQIGVTLDPRFPVENPQSTGEILCPLSGSLLE
jgi:hypothetical protein